jgi:ATP-dependent protease ClpP protease subunit
MIKKIAILVSAITLFTSAAFAAKPIMLTEANLVVLDGEVNNNSMSKVIRELVANKSDTIFLYINSGGGSVLDGFKLIHFLQNTKKNIHCIAEYAASMAHGILQACPVRLATSENILMQHKPTMRAQGSPSEIEGQLSILKALEDSMAELESKRIGISKAEYDRLTFLPWYTAGKESLKQNVVDAIVQVDCSEELYNKTSSKSVRTMFGELEVIINACPLVPVAVTAI